MILLADAVELVKVVKKAAVDAMDATKPVNICYGTVESVSPLKIRVEQKILLGAAQLALCRNVTDYAVHVTVECQTESGGQEGQGGQGMTEPGGIPEHTHNFRAQGGGAQHTHAISGKKEVTVHNGLSVGDNVIMLRQQGGQKYIVWDRIGGM